MDGKVIASVHGWNDAPLEEGTVFVEGEIDARNVGDVYPSADDVVRERDKRLSAGFDYDFGDERGVHRIGTTTDDMAGWSEVNAYADALLVLGDSNTRIDIETDTGCTHVTATEWKSVMLAAARFRQPLWVSSFTLLAASVVPDDYTSDKYWTP